MKVIAKIWFNAGATIGIVIVKKDDGDVAAYIKDCESAIEQANIEHVVTWGTDFPLLAAFQLVRLKGEIVDVKLWNECVVPTQSEEYKAQYEQAVWDIHNAMQSVNEETEIPNVLQALQSKWEINKAVGL